VSGKASHPGRQHPALVRANRFSKDEIRTAPPHIRRMMSQHDTVTEPAIAELVDRFYAKVRQDPVIGPIFNEAVDDWDEHLATLSAFWSSVMLTTGRYKGNPMAAHMKHPIRPEFFDRWLQIWGETVGEMFAPDAAAQFRHKAARIGESLKLGLFFRPNGLTIRPPA
jgi:hemoglobin